MGRLWLCLAFCLVISSNVFAQGVSNTQWTTWVYNDNGQAWLVTNDGIVLRTQRLIRRALVFDFPAFTVSHTGRYIAYGSDPFTVVDTQTGRTTVSFEAESTFSTMYFAWLTRPFSADDSTVAFGFGESNYQTNIGTWEVVLLDTQTGQVLHRLHSGDPNPRALNMPDFNFWPVIVYVDETTVSFILFPDGRESGPVYDGYTWNFQTDEISLNTIYTTMRSDSLPTGERIYHLPDNRFEVYPCEGECGQFIHFNTIHVVEPNTDTSYPVCATATLNLSYVYFIQNGERILAQGRPFDDGGSMLVVERDGTLVSRFTIDNITSIQGTTDGFVYTTTESNQLLHVNTRKGETTGSLIWTAPEVGNLFSLWASDPVGPFSYTPWEEAIPPASN